MTTTQNPCPTYRVANVAGLWCDPGQAQEGYAAERIVLVDTVGVRGGSPVQWVVAFNRRGVLDHATRDDRPGVAVSRTAVPDVVSEAAHRVWITSPSWVPARPLAPAVAS